MGVTVHFEGKLRDERAYAQLLSDATDFAAGKGWPAERFLIAHTTLKRVREEKDWDYTGPTKGVELRPHPSSEPLRLEFDQDFYIQEYIKTQFAPIEVHKEIAVLLRKLSSYFTIFEVFDEGEYYETEDESLLVKHRDSCFKVLDENLANDSALRGPVRLPSGRIADLVRDP